MPKKDNIVLIRQILKSAETSIKSAQKLLDEMKAPPSDSKGSSEDLQDKASHLSVLEGGKIIEGVFDGQNMVGPDGRVFPVPANYASKSKLIEGDILKLTISDDGSFIFKQIGPVDRKKIMGVVVKDGDEYKVIVDDKSYRVLLASITYFKAEENDEVTIVVPRDKESTWAAVENVIKKGDLSSEALEDISEKSEEDSEELDDFTPVDIESEDDDFLEVSTDKKGKKKKK
jgi:hypothetical protein